MELKGYYMYRTKINSKAFAIPILIAAFVSLTYVQCFITYSISTQAANNKILCLIISLAM